MNTLTATLCKKQALGIAMWLMALCTSNQALHEKYIDLGNTGVLLSETFDAPMEERYRLLLLLLRPATGDTAPPSWNQLLCGAIPNDATSALPLHLSARFTHLATPFSNTLSGSVACPLPQHGTPHTLNLGTLPLAAGSYRIELINHTAHPALRGARVQVLLRGEGAGFP